MKGQLLVQLMKQPLLLTVPVSGSFEYGRVVRCLQQMFCCALLPQEFAGRLRMDWWLA